MSPILLSLVSPLLLSLIFATPLPAQDPFAEGVRSTEPLSAAEARERFQLPPGFEVQLVASEPEIFKPLNMAFDARGRLWITDTLEYPYAVPVDKPGRDTVKILEDTNGDGRADKITTFADGLNIPIGIYPCQNGAIVYSIPHIWRMRDTDGDGVADHRQRLYGPMGFERDTHGMNNAFRRGFDGWLYSCHGFNNETTVSGSDGHVIKMQSGNTYRMRLDGTRVEQFTWGQVNPFGMCFDPTFNIFTADCHSKPVYQLLRGGYYPSFGKPDDGLGFVPPMMEHLHGSTAIAGVVFYAASQFPAEFQGNLFSGNVMTSRVNRNSLEYHGSTIVAHEQPDFLATSDPWFRPVDLALAPDGSLYIADFYNRIIGHYEVALDHPGRDRHRGRIWRVVYTGDVKGDAARTNASDGSDRSRRPIDLTKASAARLVEQLGDDSLTRRLLAADELVDRIGADAIPEARKAIATSSNPRVRVHSLWVASRLGSLSDRELARAARDEDRDVRVHVMKILSETTSWSDTARAVATRGLDDSDAFVRRAACDALGRHPRREQIPPLLRLIQTTADADNHLIHAAKMALRDQLTQPGAYGALSPEDLSPMDRATMLSVSLAVPSSDAADWLLSLFEFNDGSLPQGKIAPLLRHAARHLPEGTAGNLASVVRQRFPNDLDLQTQLIAELAAGLTQRGVKDLALLRPWGGELVERLLASSQQEPRGWRHQPLPGKSRAGVPWFLQERASGDGVRSLFLCSLPPGGEELTSRLRSPEFDVPDRLSFYLAGHLGPPPTAPPMPLNYVVLRDAKTNRELARALPPRNDTAQRVDWKLDEQAGQRAYLEIVDGDDGNAYAWLAIGRFSPPVVALPNMSPSQASQRQVAASAIVGRLSLDSFEPHLTALLNDSAADPTAWQAAAQALVALRPDSRVAAMAGSLADPTLPSGLGDAMRAATASRDEPEIQRVLIEFFQSAPRRIQQSAAQALATDASGATVLLELVEQGKAAPRLLTHRGLRAQIVSTQIPDVETRIDALTQSLPTDSETVAKLVEQRRRGWSGARPDLEAGSRLFAKHCAACHQLEGKGPLIGPQLDGIGARGVERLLEDLLDPNRNVDVAFRTTTLVLESGKILTGLERREEGAALVLVDSQGKEFTVGRGDVAERTKNALSLMPENLTGELPERDFLDLLGFLLSKREKR